MQDMAVEQSLSDPQIVRALFVASGSIPGAENYSVHKELENGMTAF